MVMKYRRAVPFLCYADYLAGRAKNIRRSGHFRRKAFSVPSIPSRTAESNHAGKCGGFNKTVYEKCGHGGKACDMIIGTKRRELRAGLRGR